jgi:hypothetical protein
MAPNSSASRPGSPVRSEASILKNGKIVGQVYTGLGCNLRCAF